MIMDFSSFSKEECLQYLNDKTNQLNSLITRMVALSEEERNLLTELTNNLATCRTFAASKGWLD